MAFGSPYRSHQTIFTIISLVFYYGALLLRDKVECPRSPNTYSLYKLSKAISTLSMGTSVGVTTDLSLDELSRKCPTPPNCCKGKGGEGINVIFQEINRWEGQRLALLCHTARKHCMALSSVQGARVDIVPQKQKERECHSNT